jgi:hypothetical protein
MARAERWLLGSGWQLVGNETGAERTALDIAFRAAVEWFAAFLEGLEPRWLVMVGVSGTGKTMLAKRIVEYVQNYGRQVYERTVAVNLPPSHMGRSYVMAQQGPVFAPWRKLLWDRGLCELAGRDWFCVIDELKSESGKGKTIDGEDGIQPEPWEVRTAGNLFDDMLRKWRVVTMNLTRGQIALFWDVRIASRLIRDDNVIADLSDVSDYGLRKEQALKNQP